MQVIKGSHHMRFTRLAVRFAIMTILCSTTVEAKGPCPVGGCPPPPPPPVVIPTAVTTCACVNEAALEAAARSYLSNWIELTPPGYSGVINAVGYPTLGVGGTRVFMISTSAPITGIYYYKWSGGVFSLTLVNPPTDAAAVANDMSILTRSVKMEPIHLPSSLPIHGTDPIDLLAKWVAGDMAIQGGMSTSLFHALATLIYAAVYTATFKDSSTGQIIHVYSGEAFTLYDSNGWSIQIIWNPFGPNMWTNFPGSVRDNHGNKVNIVNNVATTPISATGSPMLGAAITVMPPLELLGIQFL